MPRLTNDYDEATPVGFAVGTLVVIAAIVLVIVGFGWITAFTKTNGGEVAVVRNGGLFDNNKVRQVIDPASSLTNTGLWSKVHRYPAQQRFYKISADSTQSDSGQVDKVNTPTSDGVSVGIEGTIYFSLTRNHDLLKRFDDKYGTRAFGKDGLHPYEGDEGFSAFLNTIMRPVIDNNLRKEIGAVTCANLVSSCALVQNEGNAKRILTDEGQKSQQVLRDIEDSINRGLQADIQRTLGGAYLNGIKFSLVRVDLPPRVDRAVEEAQAAFGEISKSEARRQQAKNDADANKLRQRGYQDCPACAQIDSLKAIPENITTFAPGGGFAVTQKP